MTTTQTQALATIFSNLNQFASALNLIDATSSSTDLALTRINIQLVQESKTNPQPDYSTLINELHAITEANPNHAEAFAVLGNAYRLNQDIDLAMTAYQTALTLAKKDADSKVLHDAYLGMALIHLFYTKNNAEAQKLIKKGLKLYTSIDLLSAYARSWILPFKSTLSDDQKYKQLLKMSKCAKRILAIQPNHVDGVTWSLYVAYQKAQSRVAKRLAKTLENLLNNADYINVESYAYTLLPTYYLHKHQFSKVTAFLRSLIEQFPSAHFFYLFDTFQNDFTRSSIQIDDSLKALQSNSNDLKLNELNATYQEIFNKNYESAYASSQIILNRTKNYINDSDLLHLVVSSYQLGYLEESQGYANILKSRATSSSINSLIYAYFSTDQLDEIITLSKEFSKLISSRVYGLMIYQALITKRYDCVELYLQQIESIQFSGYEYSILFGQLPAMFELDNPTSKENLMVYQWFFDRDLTVDTPKDFEYQIIFLVCAFKLSQLELFKSKFKEFEAQVHQSKALAKTLDGYLTLMISFNFLFHAMLTHDGFTKLGGIPHSEIDSNIFYFSYDQLIKEYPSYLYLNIASSATYFPEIREKSLELLLHLENNNVSYQFYLYQQLSKIEKLSKYAERIWQQLIETPEFLASQDYAYYQAEQLKNTNSKEACEWALKGRDAHQLPKPNSIFKYFFKNKDDKKFPWHVILIHIFANPNVPEEYFSHVIQYLLKIVADDSVLMLKKQQLCTTIIHYYARKNNYEKVIEWCTFMIQKINKQDVSAYYFMSRAFLNKKEFKQSLQWAQWADQVSNQVDLNVTLLLLSIHTELDEPQHVQYYRNRLIDSGILTEQQLDSILNPNRDNSVKIILK